MSLASSRLTVGIAGAGAAAFALAAFLERAGHRAVLWSPSGRRTAAIAAGAPLAASGALEGSFAPAVATDAEALACGADVVIVAVPGFGLKPVIDALVPHLRSGQPVIFSAHLSFAALFLGTRLAARGVSLPIVTWGTTLAVARQNEGRDAVKFHTLRKRIDVATLPAAVAGEGQALCQALFGDRFVPRNGLLAISLSNVNPQNHMGISLCNLTRIENGEVWPLSGNVTPAVGRLLEALDAERLAIAAELGLEVRSVIDHFQLSFDVPRGSVHAMNQEIHRRGQGGNGPVGADTRYVTEDVPYGLQVTATLGELVGRPARLHRIGVEVFSALYGRDFAAENRLLAAMDLPSLSLDALRTAAATGVLPRLVEDCATPGPAAAPTARG